jgi:hypothetical protein
MTTRTLVRQVTYDPEPVGSIKHSMLTETEFQDLNGDNWVLADGRPVGGSDYALEKGVSNIPDMRGRFLRGGDWAGMTLGDEQEATRVISIAENGGGVTDIYATRNRSVQPADYDPDPAGSLTEEGTPTFGRLSISTAADGTNDRRGVVRTRPRSTVVNIFIKINNFGTVVLPDVTPDTIVWSNFNNTSSDQTFTGINTPITIEVSATNTSGTPTLEYRKNGGAWIGFTVGAPASVSISSGDSLGFQVSGTDTDAALITVTNTSDGDAVLDTVTGTVSAVLGDYKSYDFSGSLGWYQTTSPGFNTGLESSSSWSVSCWLKIAANSVGDTASIFSTDWDAGYSGITVVVSDGTFAGLAEGELSFEKGSGGVALSTTYYSTTGTSYNDGQWHNITITYNNEGGSNGTTRIYIDATLVHTEPSNGTGAGHPLFGEWLAATWANFRIAQSSIYNKELVSAEVTELYNSGTTIDETTSTMAANLQHYYRFGDNASDTDAVIKDEINVGVTTNFDLLPNPGGNADIVFDHPGVTFSETIVLNEDFESGLGTNGWTLVDSAVSANAFIVGTDTFNNGANSLYVSSDGVTNTYITSSPTSYNHAYVDVAIPSGSLGAVVSMAYKGDREFSFDFGKLSYGVGIPAPAADVDYTSGSSTEFTSSLVWANKEIDVSAFLGQTVRFVFTWKSDSTATNFPPLAIDDFIVKTLD